MKYVCSGQDYHDEGTHVHIYFVQLSEGGLDNDENIQCVILLHRKFEMLTLSSWVSGARRTMRKTTI